jgi:hypothetical protein
MLAKLYLDSSHGAHALFMATSYLRSLFHFSFAPLFRLFMTQPRPDDLPELFPDTPSINGVYHWALRIQTLEDKADCCFVETIKYCKCTQPAYHEFLVICIRHQPTGHKAYLAINRSSSSPLDPPRTSSEELLQTARILSSSLAPASDTVTVSHDGTAKCVIPPKGDFNVIAIMTFAQPLPPTVVYLASLAKVVSAHRPNYQIIYNQCYWHTFSIWQVMADRATNIEEKEHWGLRGKYKLSTPALGEGDSLDDIKIELARELQRVEEEGRSREQKRQAKEEQVSRSFQVPFCSFNLFEVAPARGSTGRPLAGSTGGPAAKRIGTHCTSTTVS